MQVLYLGERLSHGCLTVAFSADCSSGFCRFNWDCFYGAGVARSLLTLVSPGRSGVGAKRPDTKLATQSQFPCRTLRPYTKKLQSGTIRQQSGMVRRWSATIRQQELRIGWCKFGVRRFARRWRSP
ncbi:hypothetical protein H6F95_22715 [Cyanobacteria bacterium FACHB-471]|nr:hypothetical protein [Cyanobacteria bacterium FACHB-471]